MNYFTPAEITANYAKTGTVKTKTSSLRLLLLGIFAGIIIATGSAVANMAACAVTNPAAAKVIGGLLFPFGLGIVAIMGFELFTGNCLIVISALQGQASVSGMLRNWGLSYLGNFIGAVLTGAFCVWSGQLNVGNGALAVQTLRAAASKCTLPFGSAVMLGILCNLLVCAGTLMASSAKDTGGKLMGAYLPVALFVICGFEHCVANMYYIPAGLLALANPSYVSAAVEAGVNVSAITMGGLLSNLLPVTLGNILGGVALGALMWYCHLCGQRTAEPTRSAD